MKTITIKDVAQAAGCSVASACIAFTGKGRIAAETRSRVLRTAEELGYRPNRSAQMLSRKDLRLCAVLPAAPDAVQSLLIRGITDGISKDAADVSCEFLTYDSDEADIIRALSGVGEAVNGIVIEMKDYTSREINRELTRISSLGVPIVKLVVGPDNLPATLTVSVDAEAGGAVAAELLAMRGCRRCAVIAGEEASGIHNRGINSFREHVQEYGMSFHSACYTDDCSETAGREAVRLMTPGCGAETPDGIFVSSYLSFAVIDALKLQGLNGNAQVVGVDLHEKNRRLLECGELLAVINQNQRIQGEQAVRILLRAILRQELPESDVKIKPEIVLKSNLGCYL